MMVSTSSSAMLVERAHRGSWEQEHDQDMIAVAMEPGADPVWLAQAGTEGRTRPSPKSPLTEQGRASSSRCTRNPCSYGSQSGVKLSICLRTGSDVHCLSSGALDRPLGCVMRVQQLEDCAMPEDPFDEARREMERARRDFDERMKRLRFELEQVAQQIRVRMAEERARFEGRMKQARQRLEAARRNRPRGGPGWPGRPGASGPRPKPPRDGPGRPGAPGSSPKPAPVRPTTPSNLSGGAEAPLDP